MKDKIVIKGARAHNLKNVDLTIPRDQLVVFTGVSGSGKSSLAFDTIYAEGQRRYVESLSSYARQFLGQMEKPDVDLIEGLSPAISIDQKTTSHNPRSTVGTVTEIYDYLRLLYARIGIPHCPKCGKEIKKQTIDQIVDRIMELPAMSEKKRLAVLSHELSSSGAETTAPLDDYMLLSRDAKTRTDTVLATRVEQSVIAGYDALAKDAGFKLTCIDLGLAAPIKAVRTIPALQNGTFVVLQFDDDTISACLFVQGQYTYSTRSRLFNPRGTAESGTEIAQKLSGLIQFHIASKSEHQIDTVYFAGADAKDFTVCRPGCEALALKVEQFPDSPTVSLPKGTALADVLYAAGNLIAR